MNSNKKSGFSINKNNKVILLCTILFYFLEFFWFNKYITEVTENQNGDNK